jgi:hypothetical protein
MSTISLFSYCGNRTLLNILGLILLILKAIPLTCFEDFGHECCMSFWVTMFLTEFSYFSPNEHRSDKVSFAEDTKYIYAKKVNCIIITTEYAVQ